MPDFRKDWRERLRERLANFLPQIRQTVPSKPGTLVYGTLAAFTLWPLVEAMQTGDLMGPVMALGSVAGGIGGNLVANLLQEWKDRETPAEVAAEIEAQAKENAELREALDAILEKLEAPQHVANDLSENDRRWFVEALKRDAEQIGSTIFEGEVGLALLGDASAGRDFIGRDNVRIEADTVGIADARGADFSGSHGVRITGVQIGKDSEGEDDEKEI